MAINILVDPEYRITEDNKILFTYTIQNTSSSSVSFYTTLLFDDKAGGAQGNFLEVMTGLPSNDFISGNSKVIREFQAPPIWSRTPNGTYPCRISIYSRTTGERLEFERFSVVKNISIFDFTTFSDTASSNKIPRQIRVNLATEALDSGCEVELFVSNNVWFSSGQVFDPDRAGIVWERADIGEIHNFINETPAQIFAYYSEFRVGARLKVKRKTSTKDIYVKSIELRWLDEEWKI